jgi:serine/threonine protein kinase
MTEIKIGTATTVVLDDSKKIEGDLCKLQRCTVKTPALPRTPGETWYDKLMEDGDTLTGEQEELAIIKTPIVSSDNDFVENEAKILRLLYPRDAPDEKFYRYLPRIIASFDNPTVVNPTVMMSFQPLRHVSNLMPWFTGYITLAEILKAYPKGIDYRDLAWMLKRTLAGIGFAHQHGVIHGAMIPPHVMVHGEGHGAKLIDWCYAVTMEAHRSIPAFVSAWGHYYPAEVFAKRLPTPATDIFMIAKCCVALLGGNVEDDTLPDAVPPPVAAMLARCLREKSSERPQNAWDLHKEFDKILEELIGKPAYRPFVMPPV